MTTLSAETVEKATAEFAAETGINIAVVVEDATDVLEVSYAPMIWGIVIAAGVTVVAVVLIVKGVKSRKKKDDPHGYNNRHGNDRYYGF
jgi:membrane protein implicated in regulation of membrane protease activity